MSRSDHTIPPLTICTGRPYPYAEAVAQWLDVQLPFVFESAGLYHWEGNRIETAVGNGNGRLKQIGEMKRWLKEELLPEYPEAALEYSKMMDAGVVCPDEDVINQIHEEITKKTEHDFPDLEVHATEVSVNILLSGNNKLQGLKLLGNVLGIGLEQMAFIGDSGGDVPALEGVKLPFAPANAREIAKVHAIVLPGKTSEAVLDAYQRIIKNNRMQV